MRPLLRMLFFFVVLTLGTLPLRAATIWDGPITVFAKPDWADWTLPENQDSLSGNVVLTRGDNRGIFNIAQEASYTGADIFGSSPIDTQWAFGTSADYQTLNFTTWAAAANGNPRQNLVNQEMVLHLITDDVYLDVEFLSWSKGGDISGGGEGAGFSYQHSTLVPEPATILLMGFGILAWIAFARRRW